MKKSLTAMVMVASCLVISSFEVGAEESASAPAPAGSSTVKAYPEAADADPRARALREEKEQHVLQLCDTNANGQIEKSERNSCEMEVKSKYDVAFDEADTNNDGIISANELHACMEKYPAPTAQKETVLSQEAYSQILKTCDDDDNNMIDKNESNQCKSNIQARYQVSLDKLDHNNDGTVSKSELKAHMKTSKSSEPAASPASSKY